MGGLREYCGAGNSAQKNLGDALGVPRFRFCRQVSVSSCQPFLLSSLLPWIYSPFHCSWICNAVLLQLFECIESMKIDVKKKMMC